MRSVFLVLLYPVAVWLLAVLVSQDPPPTGVLVNAVVLALMLGLAMERALAQAPSVFAAMGRQAARLAHGGWQGISFGVFLALLTLDEPVAEVAVATGAGGAVFGALSAAFWRDRREDWADLAALAGWQRLGWPLLVIALGLPGAALGGASTWMVLPMIVAMAFVPGVGIAPGARLRWALFLLGALFVTIRAAGIGVL